MKLTLLGDDAIRLEHASGPLTIEAASPDTSYSPFHMLASALATCTFSVLHAWATHKTLSADDLSLEVQWRFGEDPHRVSDMGVVFDWPSLPAERVASAQRVAALCTVHATLTHPPRIDIMPASNVTAEHQHGDEQAEAHMHGEPAAAPPVTTNPPGTA